MEYPVAKSENLEVTFAGILDRTIGHVEVSLLVFEAENHGDEEHVWRYDEMVLVDADGTEHDLGDAVSGETGDAGHLPSDWWTSPKIPRYWTSRCVTDIDQLDAEMAPLEIRHDYKGERFTFELSPRQIEFLRTHPKDFVEGDMEVTDFDGPYDIAVVETVTRDGVIIDQGVGDHGTLVAAPSHLSADLEPGSRVALDDGVIAKVLTEKVDTRVRSMEIESRPSVGFEDIGGLEDVIRRVREVIEEPLSNPDRFTEIGIEPPNGVLLHGPPGTGKTMLAKAVAASTDASFIRMAGSELVRKYVGEGAQMVREVFDVADRRSPAIVFIDEIDAIARQRSAGGSSGNEEVQRTLMQLLSVMDGFDNYGNVRVVAATNRFDVLDQAILRPGRFDRLVEVPKPDTAAREQIFQVHLRGVETASDIDYEELANVTDGFTGADIEATCTEAGYTAIREGRKSVTQIDLVGAVQSINAEEQARQEQR
ncbi:AAA family ATPase [Haloarchaeobius salinus]|uniref:AAA family ATPase n=1 Tax=Haloarchaeobius salinus TaxID=1198298 RepID=UPI00210D66D7|nr:AAA family ATPase [Haloarchaeobius salinus]